MMAIFVRRGWAFQTAPRERLPWFVGRFLTALSFAAASVILGTAAVMYGAAIGEQ